MKKVILLLIISTMLFTGCEEVVITTPEESHSYNIKQIDAATLVYDPVTKIVYYYHSGIAPYLGEHGRPCRYIDGKIVEVEDEKAD